MSTSTRPRSHAEREQILRAMSAYLGTVDADATVIALHARFFAEPSSAYSAARASWLSAHGAWQSASAAAEEQDVSFDNALRRLMLSLRESSGKADHELIASLLGGVTPTELMGMRYAEEVTRARALLVRLESRPDLSPSAERLATMQSATDALEAAASTLEAAVRAKRVAGEAMESANLEFDTAWGKLVRALRAVLDETTAEPLIPRFVRGESAAESEMAPA